MKIEIKHTELSKDELFLKTLKDPKVVSNSAPYMIEKYFNGYLSVLHVGELTLLEDIDGRRYKVICSRKGNFKRQQSCTKGIGRDESFGDWNTFVNNNGIDYLILTHTGNIDKLVCDFVTP